MNFLNSNLLGKDLSAAILVNWKPLQVNLETYLLIDLISVDDEKLLWSEKYKILDNWSGSEIIKCSPKISKKITRELRTILTREERELFSAVPVSAGASMYASLGSVMTSDSRYLASIQLVSRKPSTILQKPLRRTQPLPKHMPTAFKLDPKLPDANIAMGFYHYYGTDDYKLAAVFFEEAVQLRPNNF